MKGLIQAGYGYALSLTHAADEAYDLVHEAWLRLARGGQRRPHQALLFTTILAIPRGTVLSLIHRGKARLRQLLRDPVFPDETS